MIFLQLLKFVNLCDFCGKKTRNCLQYFLTLVLFTFCTCCILRCLVCIVVSFLAFIFVDVLYILLQLSCVYCCHFICICCTMCLLLILLQMPDCWLEFSIRKVLRPTTSTQVFLGFPVSISKRSDGSQHSKLPLHASHVALQT